MSQFKRALLDCRRHEGGNANVGYPAFSEPAPVHSHRLRRRQDIAVDRDVAIASQSQRELAGKR